MSIFLQSERKRLGMSAADVREKIDVSRATFTRWEAGSPIPSDKLAALVKLGFDINYVVTGERRTSLNQDALNTALGSVLTKFSDRLDDTALITELVSSFYSIEAKKEFE